MKMTKKMFKETNFYKTVHYIMLIYGMITKNISIHHFVSAWDEKSIDHAFETESDLLAYTLSSARLRRSNLI